MSQRGAGALDLAGEWVGLGRGRGWRYVGPVGQDDVQQHMANAHNFGPNVGYGKSTAEIARAHDLIHSVAPTSMNHAHAVSIWKGPEGPEKSWAADMATRTQRPFDPSDAGWVHIPGYGWKYTGDASGERSVVSGRPLPKTRSR
jgi:hypothetical protein